MSSKPDHSFDQAAHIDRVVFQERGRLIVGADSLHGLDPAEMAMRMEEAAADPATLSRYEREAVRAEIFCGLLEYLFADGIEQDFLAFDWGRRVTLGPAAQALNLVTG